MQKKPASISAFSFVELSVVLAIIGMLALGIMKTQDLINKARLSNAQNLTQNTAVKDIDNMVAWFETSLESSFLFSEELSGGQLSEWLDNNPNAAATNSATQTTINNRPRFYLDVINGGIPVVRFDGVDDFMTFDGTPLVGSSYTIFVVEQRRSSSNLMMFLGGDAANTLQIGYRNNTTLTQAHSTAVLNDFAVTAYSNPTPTIHSFWFNVGEGQKYWKNGGLNSDDASTAFVAALTSFSGAALGRYLTNYFNGDIAEIIIFNRALQTNERQIAEDYLSKKYAITIS